MKLVWFGLVAITVLVILVELALRYFFGFGRPLVYLADPEIGYLLAPNQSTRRFGNRIAINQYSMRTSSITPQRAKDTMRAFIIGDSVANGGWWTDQVQTISAVLQAKLAVNAPGAVEVLNASANSWGPRNELAYLKRFGLFDTQYLILIINTDDLFSTTPTPLAVGIDRNYPDRLPMGAIAEVIQRYGLPAPKPSPELQKIQSEGGDRVGRNLAAIAEINQMAQTAGANFLLIMTPLLREVEPPGPKDYELKARSRLLEFTQQQKIYYIDALTFFSQATPANALYHDHIHLNAMGNQQVSDRIENWIRKGTEK